MNLGKLLGVGKSFFGSDPMAAYRLNKRACLPKFNEGRNPFASKQDHAPEATTPETVAAAAPAAPKLEAKPAVVPETTPMKKTPAPYAFKPAPAPVTKPVVQPAAAKPARPGWTTRLNPFRPPEPVAPPVAEQAELSLDTIKVMHNDLADADVDVVPVKSHADSAAVAVPVLPPARHAWEYLGENLLKSS